MAQARRYKSKSTRRSGGGRVRQSQWGMLFIGLVCGAVLMALYNGLRGNESVGHLGSGLKNLATRGSDPAPVESDPAAASTPADQVSAEKEFDFYNVLKDMDQVMMDDFPDAVATRDSERKPVVYMLQAASLRKEADAEALRARLALSGFESTTQRVEVEGKGVYFRVRLGPYDSKRALHREMNKLRNQGIDAMPVYLDAG